MNFILGEKTATYIQQKVSSLLRDGQNLPTLALLALLNARTRCFSVTRNGNTASI